MLYLFHKVTPLPRDTDMTYLTTTDLANIKVLLDEYFNVECHGLEYTALPKGVRMALMQAQSHVNLTLKDTAQPVDVTGA
jgi:hypothetical protein